MPCTKVYVQNSALDIVTSLYEPYQWFSSIFIGEKTVSVARDHRWVPHRQVAKRAKSSIFFLLSSSSFSQASSIITEAMTMSQTRRSGIFYGILHAYQSALNKLKVVQEWFTSTLEWTLPVPRHFRVNNYSNVNGSSIRVWIFPVYLWLWLRMRRLPATTRLFKAYLRSCCLRSWLWSAWFMTAYVIRTLAVKWIHLHTWLIIFRWYKSKTASGQRCSVHVVSRSQTLTLTHCLICKYPMYGTC